jgi:hypothetical protein
MFQYTHLIRKYSLRSSNRARLNPEKMTIWSIFMTFFLKSPTHSLYDHIFIGYHGAF